MAVDNRHYDLLANAVCSFQTVLSDGSLRYSYEIHVDFIFQLLGNHILPCCLLRPLNSTLLESGPRGGPESADKNLFVEADARK